MSRTVVGLLAGLLMAGGLVSGCVSGGPPDAPFALSVAPREVQGFAIPGQEVVYLVSLAEGTGAAVTVTVDVDGAAARVERPDLGPDAPVAEVAVVPDAASVTPLPGPRRCRPRCGADVRWGASRRLTPRPRAGAGLRSSPRRRRSTL